MKYYEVFEPYYALIQAKDEKEASDTYIELVAGDEGDEIETEEVSRDFALIRFSRVPLDSKGTLAHPMAIIPEFNDVDNRVLLIDGSLS